MSSSLAKQLPLLQSTDLEATLAWRDRRPVSARQFLADVDRQAGLLPGDGALLNLCADRYLFAVGFGAALCRGQAHLMPPNVLPETLAQLGASGQVLQALTDRPLELPPTIASLPIPAEPAPARPVEIPLIDRGQLAATLLTSGSTGAPQPHAKTWGQLTLNVAAAARRLAELLQRPNLRGLNIVATVPAQHSYGFESSVLLGLLGGAAFDAGRPYFPADIARALAALPRPRALVTTPFHLSMLLQSSVEVPAVDLVLSATAPLSPQLAQHAERAFGGPLVEIYGCTEAGQVATRRPVKGELWQAFDNLTLSRLAGNDDSGDRFMVQGGHVFEPTGLADILELESAQRFRLLGRANDLIDVAGKRSSLGHLNFQLNSIPGVVDGAFWLPDAMADRVVRPVAFVVAPTLDAARIRTALRERLEAVFVPRRIVLVDALPRESTGKLPARALRELAQAHGVADRRA